MNKLNEIIKVSFECDQDNHNYVDLTEGLPIIISTKEVWDVLKRTPRPMGIFIKFNIIKGIVHRI